MKTFEQCCDEVAKKRGYESTAQYANKNKALHGVFLVVEAMFNEAAELFAQSAMAEAWEKGANAIRQGKVNNPYKS